MESNEWDAKISLIRNEEFSRLKNSIYLDNAGSALYSENQIKAYYKELKSNLFSNPHSKNESSMRTGNEVESIRNQVLKYFNADLSQYALIFTSGTTASLKLVGELFQWTKHSRFIYTQSNHNSVIGIREYAIQKGASFEVISIDNIEKEIEQKCIDPQSSASVANHLFAFPAQCNFSGIQFPLSSINTFQTSPALNQPGQSRCFVLLDAAAYVSTHVLDLSHASPDFTVFSFYKIFGFPTGLGGLIVRKDAFEVLSKQYFGGGTVSVSLSNENYVRFKPSPQRYEDGTVDFMNIIAIKYGLNQINTIGMKNISHHTKRLTNYLYSKLISMCHYNGQPVCVIYGHFDKNQDSKNDNNSNQQEEKNLENNTNNMLNYKQGPFLSFNLKNSKGEYIGYSEIEKLANLNDIHIRSGCFCNPGACQYFLGLSSEEIKENFENGHVCWDDKDIINNKPTGALRVSLPYITTMADIQYFIDFIQKYYVEKDKKIFANDIMPVITPSIASLYIYPIKSCSGFQIKTSWEIGSKGFVYDREWVLVRLDDDYYPYANLKSIPKLALIETAINDGNLIVTSPSLLLDPLILSLDYFPETEISCKVCGDETVGLIYGDDVTDWFTKASGVPLSLVRQSPNHNRYLKSRGRKQQENQEELIKIKEEDVVSKNEEMKKLNSDVTLKGKIDNRQEKMKKEEFGDSNNGEDRVNEKKEEKGAKTATISFSNESQFLLISSQSVDDLNRKLEKKFKKNSNLTDNQSQNSNQNITINTKKSPTQYLSDLNITVKNFRPNIVVFSNIFIDDTWKTIKIGNQYFNSTGPCNRCLMINVNEKTLKVESEPLKILSSYRRLNSGKVIFGNLFSHDKIRSSPPYSLSVDDKIEIIEYT